MLSPTPYTTPTNVATPPPCTSYVDCQNKYVQSIQAVNTSYRALLESNLDPLTSGYLSLQNNLTTAINQMKTAISNFQLFLSKNENAKTSSYTDADYAKVQSMRLELANQSDMLKSRYGAPKPYGKADNMYDEYRTNYNTMMYAFIISCLIVVVLLFFLFRSL